MYWDVKRSILILPQRLKFIRFAWRALKNYKYTCFIGVDRDGLVAASAINFLRRVPVLYWSLEIRFLSDYRDPIERMLKHLEKISQRKARLTIIQDWERARCLAGENGVDMSNFVIVPNGPLGPSPNALGDYFQRKFGLFPSRRIILYAGWITPGYLSLELARTASGWPDEWTLVFHEREKRDPSEPYLQEIQKEGKDRVRLSLEPVSYDELDSVVSSGLIGIVAYNAAMGPNWRLMTGASGKLAQYLRCGLPVVCVDCPSLGEIIQKYQCGMEVANLQNVEGAIRTILGQYDHYRANAIRCYEEVYEFGVHFRQVLQEIESF
jgi:glycosyltransferase involved in cell wall biosynthesis